MADEKPVFEMVFESSNTRKSVVGVGFDDDLFDTGFYFEQE